jgi:2-polyprenyl-3-methyl-5-hydroxy-6-metoxy-1,4-benzoquinol methylase
VAAAGGEAIVPWDREVPQVLLTEWAKGRSFAGGRALVVGAGLGMDAEFVASLGFAMTAFDIAPTAVASARERFPASPVDYRVADLLDPPAELGGPYDFVFDRGCYHAARQFDVDRFLATVEGLLRPGTEGLYLTGNAREPRSGPPVVSEAELRGELGRIFEIVRLREFRMDLRPESGIGRPLGWSCFVRRSPRATPAAGG